MTHEKQPHMIWNNTIGISPNISRLFKIFGKLSYRQVNTLSSTDINQVVLFGRVSSLHFGESKNGKNVYVSIGLVTKNSDRLCVIGRLNSYSKPDGEWRSSVTADIVSPLVGMPTMSGDDSVMEDEKANEDEEILTDEMEDKLDAEK
ncbi:hypothetical protein Smp_160540 [Schistosoma mansoni]|uniref:hypothetical protein n=1 Tax=Schistosoma mansoni TaxID=6183 RepID=UPI00022C87D4|nr:hypothetical protein Smp_160540 [Schistosoma mansoni]|eukprot:XP_018646660.1 hypothetical protein Smp_160540 [Schistosoma mansoni]